MKKILVFTSLIVATQAFGKWNEGLSVRFDIGLGVGRDFFISVPQTLSEAKNSRWVESTRTPNQPRSSLVLYTPSIDDVVLGAFYDANGDVAGLQIALPQDSVTDNVYDWTTQGFREWTAPANSDDVERTYWTTCIFFVSDATLAKSHEERVATRKGRILQEDNIYVSSFNGDLMPISTVASEVADTDTTLFTRQSCIIFMGRHYYYNMSADTECSAESLLTWFPLVDEASGVDQLIGLGFMSFLQLPESALVKNYFERPSEAAVRLIVDSGPDCLYDLAASPNALTMHIYFVDSPLLINCIST